jgi:hypothetical protein
MCANSKAWASKPKQPIERCTRAAARPAHGGELASEAVHLTQINDATLTGGQTPVDSPDVGLPPGPQWAGRLSGWDIKNMYFQLDFDTGALHLGINCFGVCGDADGDGNPTRRRWCCSRPAATTTPTLR